MRKVRPNTFKSKLVTQSSLARLLDQPNPWMDALDDHGTEPLTGSRYRALLMRELPVPWVANRLAPALLEADQKARQIAKRWREELPADQEFGFEHWLDCWHHEAGTAYEDALEAVIAEMDWTDDLRLFSAGVADDPLVVSELLWMMVNGIRLWGGDIDEIDPAVRWLVELLQTEDDRADWARRDGMGPLFVFLYERFRETAGGPTRLVPEDFDLAGHPAMSHNAEMSFVHSDDMMMLGIDSHGGNAAPLSEVLGDKPHAWPVAAGGIAAMRRAGFLSSTSLSLTATGNAHVDKVRDS